MLRYHKIHRFAQFEVRIFAVFEQIFLPNLKFKSNDFGFIRFLVQSALRGYLIRQFSSRFEPSICRLTNGCSKSIRIWALTFEGNYS